MSDTPILLWFRQDLRVADHPALHAAIETGSPILPIFLWTPNEEAPWAPGGASRWWLHRSLLRLQESLAERGARLVVRSGPALESLLQLAHESGAKSVFWTRRYEPEAIARDTGVKAGLREHGIVAESFAGNLLHEPWTIQNSAGKPFRVFTPFWKACRAQPPSAPISAPSTVRAPRRWPASLSIADLELEPKVDWAGGLRETWQPGEDGAKSRSNRFLRDALSQYPTDRDRPDEYGTSRLSPHLHFGEIAPRQIWHTIVSRAEREGERFGKSADFYLRQIAWREFAHHLLFHFPKTPQEPLREEFRRFPWRRDKRALHAWKRGETGYPIVDAGMRELWHTGWMHNRVRMIVASFLVKHLLLRWQEGAAWFWDTLVDADLANNTLGWQWTAGCGADAAPYFRIFNPMLQGKNFDPEGSYVRRWVPELAALPAQWIHQPWNAPPITLAEARVSLGNAYPRPIVEHAAAREQALQAFAMIRGK